MDKAEFKRRFYEIVEHNPKTVRLIRSAEEVNSLDMEKVMAAGVRTFANCDEAMLAYIAKCLSDGKEVAIQAAGPQNLMVTAARGLFRKPGEQTDQDKVHAIMDRLEELRTRYHDVQGRELLTGGLDSWIYREKFVEIAQRYGFVKHKSFSAHDDTLITAVEHWLNRGRRVVAAAWGDRVDVYVEPDYPSSSRQPSGESGFTRCDKCGDSLGPSSRFCSNDGDGPNCLNLACRRRVQPGDRFCTHCGRPVDGGQR